MLDAIKNIASSLESVILSKRLVDAPCCVSTIGEVTFEMERVLKAQNKDIKAQRVLELNPNHPIFAKLEELHSSNSPLLEKYVNILYAEALLQEGILPDDPKALGNAINELLMK